MLFFDWHYFVYVALPILALGLALPGNAPAWPISWRLPVRRSFTKTWAKLPFGPYLAFGALSWLFFGDAFLRWYFGFVNPQ